MIHDRLKEIYDEFDRHCRAQNIDYSIDADYYNVQAYRLVGHNDVSGVLRHMANYVKDKQVNLDYDGFPVNYDDLREKNFNVPTYNPLFKFTLEPLQEDKMLEEDQIKGSSNAHGRKQSAHPSSFRRNKTRDTYDEDPPKKKKKTEESLDRSLSFEDRLLDSINENVGISMVEPEILLTRNPAEKEEEEEESLEAAVQAESLALSKYLSILENSDDEEKCVVLEGLIERCTLQINELNRLRGHDGGAA